jgi:hypothetical protein
MSPSPLQPSTKNRTRPTVGQIHRRVRHLTRAFISGIEIDPESEALDPILAKHPRLVIAANHGPTFGPLASSLGMIEHLEAIGHGHRRYFGVTWRGFYKLPIARELATLMSGSAGVLSVESYAEALRTGPNNDFLVMPEGENCNFGDGFEVQPFLSSGFIEIAIRAGVPVLIAVNQGTENWARTFAVSNAPSSPLLSLLPSRWRERIGDTGMVSLTNPLRGRISPLRLSFALYQPQLSLQDLPTDKTERRAKLQAVGAIVRRQMQTMVSRMAALDDSSGSST